MHWIWQTWQGFEPLLAQELEAALGRPVKAGRGQVTFDGQAADHERAMRQVRTATRVLLDLGTVKLDDDQPETLYRAVQQIAWGQHLSATTTFMVRASSTHEKHKPRFVALKVKDAIVDAMRQDTGRRPEVDRERPDVTLRAHLRPGALVLGLEIASEDPPRRDCPTHRSLLAGMLWLSGWPQAAAQRTPLLDPLAQQGQLLAQAMEMALDLPPRHLSYQSPGWPGYDLAARQEVQQRPAQPLWEDPVFYGAVDGPDSLESAQKRLRRAGQGAHLKCAALEELEPPQELEQPGLICTAPGIASTGVLAESEPVYAALGDTLKRRFPGWTACVLAPDAALLGRVGLKAEKKRKPRVGDNSQAWGRYLISEEGVSSQEGPTWRKPHAESEMFANRLRKNHKRLERWARKQKVHCYRIYDADIPEYNLAIDWYQGHVHVQEYSRPLKIPEALASRRLRDALVWVEEVLQVPSERVHLKVRRKGGQQYERREEQGERVLIQEGPLEFWINLTDYLDTGIFLDQRQVRQHLGEQARGKKFLNLYSYTCTASVWAAWGGASSTTSVDLSSTYLDWGRANLAHNGLEDSGKHRFVRADCMGWLAQDKRQYDLIYLAPPTFSRSRRTQETFDVQRDHVALLRLAAARLAPEGELWFSNPLQSFTMDTEALQGELLCEDLTAAMMPQDFQRRPWIHTTWRLRKPGD